ncbi:hypothetical protein J2755_001725 [Methanohalophilus levihalophilus]|uniref:hypothetical protein n=1 Tax=Methanohalophilus levihalophilus TaxID=1431282 RepID=UPI001AE709FF|nr:hypothetical protein [Methanohalophilus levihalophilus]MBP2030777.1 hypothetical protein [Methanohalophilus levihalophilus]
MMKSSALFLAFLLVMTLPLMAGCAEPAEKSTTSSRLHDLNNVDIYKLTIDESNLVLYYSVKSEPSTFYTKYVIEGNVSNIGDTGSVYCEINTTFHTSTGENPLAIDNTVEPWIKEKLKPGKTEDFMFEKSFLQSSGTVVQKYRINVVHG